MSDTRTYAIIKWNPGFDRARFSTAKGQGLTQTSFDSVRKSLAGDKAILSWRGARPASINAGLVLWQGDHAGILAQIEADWRAWEVRPLQAAPVQQVSRIEGAGETAYVPPEKDNVGFWWKVAAVGAGAAAGAYYYFRGSNEVSSLVSFAFSLC